MQGKGFIQYHQKDKKITGSMTSQYRLQYYTIATYNNYAQTQTKSSEREKVRTSDREGEIYTSPNHTINNRDNIHLPLQHIDTHLILPITNTNTLLFLYTQRRTQCRLFLTMSYFFFHKMKLWCIYFFIFWLIYHLWTLYGIRHHGQ